MDHVVEESMCTQNTAIQNTSESESPDTLRSEDDTNMPIEKCLPEYDILYLRYWNDSESLPWKLWTIVEESAVSEKNTAKSVFSTTHGSLES